MTKIMGGILLYAYYIQWLKVYPIKFLPKIDNVDQLYYVCYTGFALSDRHKFYGRSA